jgi:hypothetical protein
MDAEKKVPTYDKKRWPPGPWDGEPDRTEFVTEAGFPAITLRNRWGALCGYVGVPPGHPWHGKSYDDLYDHEADGSIDVHGGLTYSESCQGFVCHEAKLGEPADVWWLGFDCAHAWDITPATQAYRLERTGTEYCCGEEVYRDLAYVKAECEKLARQAQEAVGK